MKEYKMKLNKIGIQTDILKLNKTAISKDINIELKRCFNCGDDFPLEDLENVYNQIVDADLFCNFCAEDERENIYSGE